MEASQAKSGSSDAAAQAAATASKAAAPASAKAAEPDVERHGVEGWQERVRRFGDFLSPHAIAGALHGLEADALVTEDEVRERLAKFEKRTVAPHVEQEAER